MWVCLCAAIIKNGPFTNRMRLIGFQTITPRKRFKNYWCYKNVGQVKQIGAILKDEFKLNNGDLSNTAVVLGDENQLTPILNSIPANIEHINITMGLPLKA